ncbi:MAG: DUF3021 domain-containing protein [Clostridia bacterium]|nr:DUF3021 domain-containing protein [Clostridia bacterium]
MNTYVKKYLHRGLMFGGFGPIVAGIVFYILSVVMDNFSLTGGQILLAIVSTYFLAFVQAGATVFNQIDNWSVGKSLLFHFGSLYLAYSICYIANSWIPFEPAVLLIFTAIFVSVYLVIWVTVYLIVKSVEKRLNKRIKCFK